MTIARRLYVVLGIMVLLISAELSALWFTIHTLSAVRAYVAGEGVWSKAEKDAAYHLEAYGRTRDPREFQAYQGLLTIWSGDHQANVEFTKPKPDMDRITAGFLRGANDPQDIPGMIALFQHFNKISFIAEAISDWTEGDVLMIRFQQLGLQLHAEVQAKQSNAVIGHTLSQIAAVNAQLTVVEDHFSDALGRGSRWLTGLVLKVLLTAALVVELTGLLLTAAITRGISMRLLAMLHASERVSRGDFEVRLDERRPDEIGRLAAAFNTMTHDLDQERRRAEDAVAAREASLREAQRLAHIGVWDWTFSTDLMTWSKEVCRLHGAGLDGTELPYASFLEFVVPEDRGRVNAAVRDARASGEQLSVDYRVTPNGETRWLCADANLERDERGKPIRMLGTMRDITERKHAEKLRLINAEFGEHALASTDLATLRREAVETISATLGVARVRLGELDGGGTALVFRAWVGWADDELEHRSFGIEKFPQAVEGIRTGRPLVVGRSSTSATGRSATVPIRGKASVLGLIEIGLDQGRAFAADDQNFLITIGTIVGMAIERDRHEQRIQHLNIELQDRYAELETFSYSVAHDLRAPLRAVAGFANALEEDYAPSLDDEAQRFLNLIVRGADQMGGLIDALLSLARVSRQELTSHTVDLSSKARAIIAELRAGEPGRNAIFSVEDGVEVAGDPILLRAVLANLLANAWKFTRGRDPSVIRFEAETRDGETVFAIKDNGIGFRTEYPEELFMPFKRLHGGEFEGTGIGLATVARIVGRHGGRVWAESVPGEGATFCFTLGYNGATNSVARNGAATVREAV